METAHPSGVRACRVDLFGAADAAWREAADQLTLSADDCAALLVEVEGDHALVTLIRSDGRRVARALAAPAQLAQAIAALKLADPDEFAAAVDARVETGPVVKRSAPAQTARRAISVMFGLLLGVRAGDLRLISPLIDTSLLLRIRSWELALITDWEVGYYDASGKGRGASSRGVALALGFARRQQLAHGEFLVGARLGLGVLRPERRTSAPGFAPIPQLDEIDSASGSIHFSPPMEYQGRLAVFLGYAQPLHRLVRLRMELSADGVLVTSHSALFRLGPYWALGTQIGIEFGAP